MEGVVKMKIHIYIAIILVLLSQSKAQEKLDGELFFPNLFITWNSETEAAKALTQKKVNKNDLVKSGVYYFVRGSTLSDKRKKDKRSDLQKAINIFENLWKTDRSNNRVTVLLAYSSTAICATDLSIEQTLQYINKARNLFTIVINKLPNNFEARAGRIRINMNMPNDMRPDDILISDCKQALESYSRLKTETQQDLFFLQGMNICYLALGIGYNSKGQKREGMDQLAKVEKKYLEKSDLELYKKVLEKYK